MTLARIRQDISNAQNHFDYVEGHPTSNGSLKAMVAIQTVKQLYILDIFFSSTYPNSAPEVYVRKPKLADSPHRYPDDRICYIHPSMWNPGRHDLVFVIARAAKWLSKYEVYKEKGQWPGAGIEH